MRLLFTSGTARGGTNFRTLMLDGHPLIKMSLDPFIPLFRSYRDALLRRAGGELLAKSATNVLDDYYFSNTKLNVMKAIQGADPDVPFDMSRWAELKTAIASRMKLASVNLIPHLDKLPAPTYREVFLNTTKVVSAVRPGPLSWAGFNDNWTVEFFPLIAQLIPDALFMLHLRDPRAVVNSSEFAEPDPAKRPTVMSFSRHLRKYLAFATVLPANEHLRDRLLITRYEPSVADPEREVRRMTDFLGVDFEPSMLDVARFRKADGSQWPSDSAIYRASTDVWRTEMPRPMAELTEFISGPEMELHGYGLEIYDASRGLSADAFAYAVRNARDCLGWRTDFPEIERTLGSEMFRERMLSAEFMPPTIEVERCFLFTEVFRQLRSARGLPS